MKNLIDYEKYDCYWILIDILNSRPLEETNVSKFQGYKKDYYESYESNEHAALIVYNNVNEPVQSLKLADISKPGDPYFLEKYIRLQDVCNTSMVWSIGKISPGLMKEVFSRDYFDNITLSEYKKNLWWSTWSQTYFGENIESIFQNTISSHLNFIKNPTFFYLNPVSAELKIDEIIDDQKKLDSIITQMHCHPTLWDVFEYTMVLDLVHSDVFNDLLFLNLRKIDAVHGTVAFPRSLYEIAWQTIFYSWLNYQQNDLTKALAARYDMADMSKELGLRQINEIYNNMLLNHVPLAKTQNILTKHFLEVEKFQKDFSIIFTDILSHQKPAKKESPYWIIRQLDHRMHTLLEQITHQQQIIEKKSNDILAILRDRLLLISTQINLRLQWSMIILTIIIALLTLVLAVSNDTLSEILMKLFKSIFLLFSK